MKNRVFPRRIDKDLHLSEQVVLQTIGELYRVGWIKTMMIERMYIEKVQERPREDPSDRRWWDRIALARIPGGHHQFGNLTLLIHLSRVESDTEFWGPDSVQLWTEYGDESDMRPLCCLYRTSHVNPLVWTHAATDERKNQMLAWAWQVVGRLNAKRKMEFLLRLWDYVDPEDGPKYVVPPKEIREHRKMSMPYAFKRLLGIMEVKEN